MTDSPKDSDPIHKPRGLWSVIAHSSGPILPDQESEAEAVRPDPIPDEPASPAPRSLFTIMQSAQAAASQEDSATVDPPETGSEAGFSDPIRLHETESSSPDDELTGQILEPIVPVGPLWSHVANQSPRRIRQASMSLLCGIASIGLSALSIRPEVWLSLPAPIAGFSAIILGYMALTGCRVRNLSTFTKIASQAGMLLGTLGIFLGPIVFAPLGRSVRESQGHSQTQQHVTGTGEGSHSIVHHLRTTDA